MSALNVKWLYRWTPSPPAGLPSDVEFIPMVGKYRSATGLNADLVAAQKASRGNLLGFNEPDQKKQGDLSVEQALEVWPSLMATGLRLGSPGCVHPDREWMKEFMKKAEELDYRVDFVCVHSYGGPSVKALVKRLTEVHEMYGKPLWITEFGVGDWKAKSVSENRHHPKRVLDFMEDCLPALDDLKFLERYAWFPSRPDSAPLGTSALFDAEGSLTPLGECYAEH